MFGRIGGEHVKGYDSVIESKVNIEGNIYTESSLFISAKMNGEIRSDSDIFIGADGLINGNIIARNICIAGTVEGAIEASGVLKLLNTGKLYGDVTVYRFIADEGAVFEGKCSMSDITALKPNPPEMRKLKSESSLFRKKDYLEDLVTTLKIDECDDMK